MKSRPRIASRASGQLDSYDLVVRSFAHDQRVICGEGTGFGSGALKVNGKIFAMISSKGPFVVKLSAERVDELVRARIGRHFEAGRGKKMKQWLALSGRPELWLTLAMEALQFVANK